MFLKDKLKQHWVIVVFGILILFDLVGVDRRYVNNEDFVSAIQVNKPYQANEADKAILTDTTNFRVFDITSSGAKASYFHNSLNGYHAAKLQRYQDVFDFYISRNNINVLNMFNTKYIIAQDEQGAIFPYDNPDANGNAWFIKEFKVATSANEEIQALDSLNNKKVAVINKNDFKIETLSFKVDSTASITLLDNKPNYLKYKSVNQNNGFAVFSEVYYPIGWKTIIDGKEASHIRVNYVLRGMEIPAGEHVIEFKFEPGVIQTGSSIALGSSILVGLLFIGGLFYQFRKK